MTLGQTALPTYESIAKIISEEGNSGTALAGWTVARSLLIIPGVRLVGVPMGQAVVGSVIASSTISALALLRYSYLAREEGIRKDFPMKALGWVAVLAAAAGGAYWYSESQKKKPTNPASELIDPYTDSVSSGEIIPIPGGTPPLAPVAPIISNEEPGQYLPTARRTMGGLNGLRINVRGYR